MKTSLVVIALTLSASSAQALYKCTGSKGEVTFQDAPCANAQKQQAMTVRAAPPDAAASVAGGPEQRLLATMTRDRRIRELEFAIASLDADVVNRNRQMNLELDELRNRKAYAKNNLAGATWEQSLSTEMQSVSAKYKTMNEADFERLKQLRGELATYQQGASAR